MWLFWVFPLCIFWRNENVMTFLGFSYAQNSALPFQVRCQARLLIATTDLWGRLLSARLASLEIERSSHLCMFSMALWYWSLSIWENNHLLGWNISHTDESAMCCLPTLRFICFKFFRIAANMKHCKSCGWGNRDRLPCSASRSYGRAEVVCLSNSHFVLKMLAEWWLRLLWVSSSVSSSDWCGFPPECRGRNLWVRDSVSQHLVTLDSSGKQAHCVQWFPCFPPDCIGQLAALVNVLNQFKVCSPGVLCLHNSFMRSPAAHDQMNRVSHILFTHLGALKLALGLLGYSWAF